MYLIIVYDIAIERVNKINRFLKQYLNWIQNSVFEGEVTKSQYKQIKDRINDIVNTKYDSIIIFEASHKNLVEKTIIGIEKGKVDRFL